MRKHIRIDFVARDAAGATTTLRYATIPHFDASGNWIDGRVKSIVARRDFFTSQRVRGGFEPWDYGIVLQNADGALDTLRSYAFDGETIKLFELNDDFTLTPLFNFIESLVGEQPLFDYDTVSFAARDKRHLLRKPAMRLKYAGTNTGAPLAGIEGVAGDLKGKPKPMLIGTVFNVSPPLVNTTKLIYQVEGWQRSGTPPDNLRTGWTMTVYDKRAALTAGANYASQADMEATAPAAGQYRVWPAGGCFRLGSAPTGIVTVDVVNPVETWGGTSLGNILRELSAASGAGSGIPYFDSDPTAGIYVDSERSWIDIFQEISSSVGASLLFGHNHDTTGVTAGGSTALFTQLGLPAALAYTPIPDIELDQNSIVPGSLRHDRPQEEDRGLPVWRVNLNYKRNYTVMNDDDLAGVAASDREFCKKEWRTVTAEDSAVKTQWLNATELNVYTVMTVEADAQAEADRLLDIFGTRREMFTFTVHYDAIRQQSQFESGALDDRWRYFEIGCVVNLTYPRFGLDAGKRFVVIGMQENFETDMLELTVWG